VEQLKPCPFCGGRAAVAQNASVFLDYRVYCKQCGAETGMYTTAIKAVRCWNNRSACDDCQMGGVPATEENMAKYGWVKERTCHNADNEPDSIWFKCSNCGESLIVELRDGGYGVPYYCPCCGAKVVEE
jgi:Lar family restriction alleviation protein